eukprot:CAMPEP_0168512580 /NCGR_PEP_ID=MMETSP0405-20121227/2885_1 /TAXON_ID=498012 /ORGANISM="Trichosphaerium sp, Strain Am-I-7 wt" /LENGTH=193 /DNA_ID=CAMNT_0008531115 /DNA_START=97 /DNA_END=674 /DNA_ORIENTATION=-
MADILSVLSDPILPHEESLDKKQRVQSSALVTSMLKALHEMFRFQTVEHDTFEQVLPCLMKQLVAVEVGSRKMYQERVEDSVIPTIVQLAVSVGQEELWKPLNHQVLYHTRNKVAIVRFAALRTMEELYTRLQTDFLPMLPESAQYIHELMEDSNQNVERLALRVVKMLETTFEMDLAPLLQPGSEMAHKRGV